MGVQFWIGLALSIPIGLAVNLLAPRVQRSLDSRSTRVATRRAQQRAEFEGDVREYAKQAPLFYSYLLSAILRTTYIGALFGILTGLLAGAATAINTASYVQTERFWLYEEFVVVAPNVLAFLAQLAALIGAVLILNIARNALATIQAVKKARTAN